ncbi:actin-like ATPase domain-containing protein [Acephala macrosclerotiorum]|nr:actin-like ATPase domain-containing protein [Acephala macrosclerotiorum]
MSYFLIGIDFGTTYSGAAWIWSGRPDEIQVVKHWNGVGVRRTSGKVPTKILYKENTIKWGFDIPPEEKPLQWFKLLLLREEEPKHPYMDDKIKDYRLIKDARQELKRLNKSAEDVVADYLRLLWHHVLEEIKRVAGKSVVESHPFRVVLTFPAIWPVYAQSRIRQAATIAGILDDRNSGETRLNLCAEPEAAALAVMEDFQGTPVDSGDIFVVCDVGGGTADLITYQLQDAGSWKIAECALGAGKLCGGIFVDEAFEQKMTEWMTPRKWRRYDEVEKQQWKDENWETTLKRNFVGADQELQLVLPLEMSVNNHVRFRNPFKRGANRAKPKIRNHRLLLQRQDLASIFDVCVDKIVALVQDQIKKTRETRRVSPKAVFLVGGFGQSRYLYSRLRDETGIEIRVPAEDKAWTAVCRGALMRASIIHANEGGGGIMRAAQISSRMMRASYGIEIIEPFDSRRHQVRDREYVPSVGGDCAMHQMHWYIRVNENISDQTIIKLDWSKNIQTPLRGNRFTINLWRCDRDVPPDRREDDVVEEGVINCTVDTPFEQLPRYTNPRGEEWRHLDFQVEMKPQGTMLQFAVFYNGTRQRALHVNPPFATTRDEVVPAPHYDPPLPLLLHHRTGIVRPMSTL